MANFDFNIFLNTLNDKQRTAVLSCRTEAEFEQVIDDYDIDVVLTGHGHNYTRSYQMRDNAPVKDEAIDYSASDVTVQDPDGTVYFELSTSASKNYENNKAGYNSHIAKSFAQNNIQSYSLVKVTDASFTVETYRTDTDELYDSYTINKTDRAKLDRSIKKAERMIDSGDYSGEKLENLTQALDQAKAVQAQTQANGELEKAYDAAVLLDEKINDMKPILYGDVNGDGVVRINDVIVLQRYIAGYDVKLSPRQLEAAAVVSDGSPIIIDATQIQRYLVGLVASLDK